MEWDLFDLMESMRKQTIESNRWFVAIGESAGNSNGLLHELELSIGDRVYLLNSRDDINWIHGFAPKRNKSGWISSDLLSPLPDCHVSWFKINI